jgi:hypothetical protein
MHSNALESLDLATTMHLNNKEIRPLDVSGGFLSNRSLQELEFQDNKQEVFAIEVKPFKPFLVWCERQTKRSRRFPLRLK